ncbi:MAG: recombination protein O N-terminal domain-containing protein, partial [Planctomycetes bacterium]|nr:recombination protein O N-terminal domain-containing protein [Planctomycetota bacterium]
MSLKKCEAVVLRKTYFGNTSLVASFLSPAEGLVEAVAKGCRRPQSAIGGRLDYFARGELVYYHKT